MNQNSGKERICSGEYSESGRRGVVIQGLDGAVVWYEVSVLGVGFKRGARRFWRGESKRTASTRRKYLNDSDISPRAAGFVTYQK